MLNGIEALPCGVASAGGVPAEASRSGGPDCAPIEARPGCGSRDETAPSPVFERRLRRPAEMATPAAQARIVRNAAVRALLAELVTYPKPGLVSLCDSGSHRDMDAATFFRSSFALRRYFERAAAAGAADASFAVLNRLGREAEVRMLSATGGVNTHRGAIFNLGLLAAAAGARRPGEPIFLGQIVARRWGPAIAAHRRDAASHGSRITARYGVGGAQAEAAGGFASVYGLALPAYRAVLAEGGSANQARVQAFFELMARVADTNLLHRGGPAGLAYAQAQARGFLHDGGVRRPGWQAEAVRVHRGLVERWLSPGGSADLLAACLFVAALED